jgi:hypothetical protein
MDLKKVRATPVGYWKVDNFGQRFFMCAERDLIMVSERLAYAGSGGVPDYKGSFCVWFRTRAGFNRGNTCATSGYDSDSVKERTLNRKDMYALADVSDYDFDHCVRWLGFAYPGETAKRVFQTFGTDLTYTVIEEWQRWRSTSVDIMIALASTRLSDYVFLWIIDWLLESASLSEYKKIKHITATLASIKRTKQIAH